MMKNTQKSFALLLAGSLILAGCGRINSSTTYSFSSPKPAVTEDVIAKSKRTDALNPMTPHPTSGVITSDKGYSDSNQEISVLGVKEYKKLKSKNYTDRAKKGKKFLVLFLKIRNRTSQKIYFNVNYLSAIIDGKEIKNTVLFNEPEGYPTIFSNISADSYYGGFIVWEVPKDWRKLEFTYTGWKDINGLNLTGIITSKDLSEPEKYSKTVYAQNEE